MNTCPLCRRPVNSDGILHLPDGRTMTLGVLCDSCADLADRERAEELLADMWRGLFRQDLISEDARDAWPNGLAGVTLTPSQIAVLTHADSVISGKTSLWISGPVGCGKSSSCTDILIRAFRAGKTVAEVSGRRLLRDGDRSQLWKEWLYADVLHLDDIDKAEWTNTAGSIWWELAERRKKRVTLVTANTSASEFAKTLTGLGLSDNWIRPSLSRLMPCEGVKMTGEDLRKKGEKKS